MPWIRVHKGDDQAREMADNHYNRQTPGAKMFTRPGYAHVLRANFPMGRAVWVWWRPKWEDGRPGTERKDKLRVIECTLFRREGETPLASALISSAVDALSREKALRDLHHDTAGVVEFLLTGVASAETVRGRSRRSLPGACYRHAGWTSYPKSTRRADIWLQHPAPRLWSLRDGR